MEKKQNSIDWLVNVVQSCIAPNYIPQEIIKQAKEMHKEEIENAQIIAISNADMTNNRGYFDTEQYYNETFGDNNE